MAGEGGLHDSFFPREKKWHGRRNVCWRSETHLHRMLVCVVDVADLNFVFAEVRLNLRHFSDVQEPCYDREFPLEFCAWISFLLDFDHEAKNEKFDSERKLACLRARNDPARTGSER